ncbi:hypothetical protein KUV51_20560 [Tateyamaria omphalii]|uniref:AAA family ATPase n=1 Tax=Tateyamaria omphalii TaxID=299262 RepID=UPI001C99E511|nr:AAA family ATPase [Tateyamaria omphalii]MBY5935411.1 hypothetical protein [Tateyamaria omphalii]
MLAPNASADLRTALSHIRWLGGGSGAGKTTLAKELAQTHGARLYSSDDTMRDHAALCPAEQCPRLDAFKRMSMDERWVDRSPEAMLDSFHWFAGEGFNLIVQDLLALPKDTAVIAEGFRLLPSWSPLCCRAVATRSGSCPHRPSAARLSTRADQYGKSRTAPVTPNAPLPTCWRAMPCLPIV